MKLWNIHLVEKHKKSLKRNFLNKRHYLIILCYYRKSMQLNLVENLLILLNIVIGLKIS